MADGSSTRNADRAAAAALWGPQVPPTGSDGAEAVPPTMITAAIRLQSALDLLPSTGLGIALNLEARSMRGEQCYSAGCPSSNYLGQMVGWEVVAGLECITVDTAHWHIRVTTPPALQDFMRRFDSGEFPLLVDDGTSNVVNVHTAEWNRRVEAKGASFPYIPVVANEEATDHDL